MNNFYNLNGRMFVTKSNDIFNRVTFQQDMFHEMRYTIYCFDRLKIPKDWEIEKILKIKEYGNYIIHTDITNLFLVDLNERV